MLFHSHKSKHDLNVTSLNVTQFYPFSTFQMNSWDTPNSEHFLGTTGNFLCPERPRAKRDFRHRRAARVHGKARRAAEPACPPLSLPLPSVPWELTTKHQHPAP